MRAVRVRVVMVIEIIMRVVIIRGDGDCRDGGGGGSSTVVWIYRRDVTCDDSDYIL